MATAPPQGPRSSPAAMGTVGTPGWWIIGALVVVVITGLIGGLAFESGDDGQALMFALNAIGGVIASFLLVVRHVRAGRDLAAAGFAGLGALAVAAQVAGYTGPGSETVLGSMALLFLPALLLIAAEDWSPVWARAAAAIAGLLLAIWSLDYILGDQTELPDVEAPLLIIGYLLLTVAAIGWILTVKDEDRLTMPTSGTGSTAGRV